MKESDVNYLINEWEKINKATSPSSNLIDDNSEAANTVKEISFLSSRKEFWEPIVCLLAYEQEPFNQTNQTELFKTIEQDIKNRSYSQFTNNFLDYSEKFATISRDKIKSGLDVIVNVTTSEKVSDIITHTSRYLTCHLLYKDDPDKLIECLKNNS